ncbi:hypothetical protein [Desulfatibacillum aliphaticivorans]|uniref:hypothetical protein n=1 Tax=Desulfatibacillum aliphaticivorans TaxID=218208 RepID=UPI000400F918|nr:hypothetical protein [Desulfatibacillum aliphaticivorans]
MSKYLELFVRRSIFSFSIFFIFFGGYALSQQGDGILHNVDENTVAAVSKASLLPGKIVRVDDSEYKYPFMVYNASLDNWSEYGPCLQDELRFFYTFPRAWDLLDDFMVWAETKDNLIYMVPFAGEGHCRKMQIGPIASNVLDLEISPDKTKIACLLGVNKIHYVDEKNERFDLGVRCRLVVLDIASGRIISPDSLLASDAGLCWLPDSKAIVYSAFKDTSLYDEDQGSKGEGSLRFVLDDEPGIKTIFGAPRFVKGVFKLDINTWESEYIVDGSWPMLNSSGNYILCRGMNENICVDLETKATKPFGLSNLPGFPIMFSPDGRFLMCMRPSSGIIHRSKNIFSVLVVDTNDSSKCYHVDGAYGTHRVKYVWIDNLPTEENDN